MNFKAVWGFDPDEALQAQNAFRNSLAAPAEANEIDRDAQDEGLIPRGQASQIYELQRMFRF